MPGNRKTLAAIFVRHGETDANQGNGEELVRGQSEFPLNEDGKRQAVEAGQAIAGNADISKVYASPLSRGRDTAKSIAKASDGVPSVRTPGLLPWDKGDSEGKPVATEDPKLRRFAQEKPDEPVPGGESYDASVDRFTDAARSIVNAGKKGTVAAVSHSVDMRLLPHIFEGAKRPDPLNGGPKPGEMMGVTTDEKVVKLKPGLWGSK